MGGFQNNPSIGWVHPKSTHARPLDWGNNKTKQHWLLERERERAREREAGDLWPFALVCFVKTVPLVVGAEKTLLVFHPISSLKLSSLNERVRAPANDAESKTVG